MRATSDSAGLRYGPGIVGKHRFRVRELYVAQPVAPLIKQWRVDAVKLDLVLRGIALLPQHAWQRQPGFILRHPNLTYESLFDMVRNPRSFSVGPIDSDDGPSVVEKKRKWVGEQMKVLEDRNLVRRIDRGDGLRPDLLVLRDAGDGEPFDDPGSVASEPGNSYVTILGSVIAGGHLRSWGAPELVGYICAMVGERYQAAAERERSGEAAEVGEGR